MNRKDPVVAKHAAPWSSWSAPGGATRDLGLHVRCCGTGSVTVVLLHGLAGSNRYFGSGFDVLAQEAKLVVPDLLGFGRSPRGASGDYGIEAHAQAVISALEALGADGPMVFGAHSMGTPVALRVAVRRPEWVRRVVAFGPPLYRSAQSARRRIRELGFWLRQFATDTCWARLACWAVCRHPVVGAPIFQWLRPELPAEIARDALEHSWASYRGSIRNLILADGVGRDLQALRVPVHLIAGAGDSLVDLVFLEELSATHPHVQVEVWPGEHDLPLVAADRCVELLRRLVRGVEEPVRWKPPVGACGHSDLRSAQTQGAGDDRNRARAQRDRTASIRLITTPGSG